MPMKLIIQMGATDSRKILGQIDEKFKSIRKYCDALYGEITVLEDKLTKRQYALIEKSISAPSQKFFDYLSHRNHNRPNYLLRLHEVYDYEIAMCSDIRSFFFLVEYSSHTLFQQILQRQTSNRSFSLAELLSIFSTYIDIVMHPDIEQSDMRKGFKYLISNSFVVYQNGELRGLESTLKNDSEIKYSNFSHLYGFDEKRELYLSPQAFMLLCRGESFKAKQISYFQESLVFSLAMNYLECILLADLSIVYDTSQEGVDYDRFKEMLSEVKKQYGDDLYILIQRMTHQNTRMRPTLMQVKDTLVRKQKKLWSEQLRSGNVVRNFGGELIGKGVITGSNSSHTKEAIKPNLTHDNVYAAKPNKYSTAETPIRMSKDQNIVNYPVSSKTNNLKDPHYKVMEVEISKKRIDYTF